MRNNYGHRADGTPLENQYETILYFLQTTGQRITQGKATDEFGFTRLSAIVKEIEYRKGIVLKRRTIKVGTRYGGTTHVTEYWYENTGSGEN